MRRFDHEGLVRVVVAAAFAATILSALPAAAETCTLKRDTKVVVGRTVVVAEAGTALRAEPPAGEWSAITFDGLSGRVSRRSLAVACAEGPLFAGVRATPSTTSPPAATIAPPPPPATASWPLPDPTPCRPAAERQLERVRAAAQRGDAPATIEAQAAMARVVDGRCIEAHAWLAWARHAAGDDVAALATWDELWTAWDDAPPWALEQRSLASGVAVAGRLAALRALRTALPIVVEQPSLAPATRAGTPATTTTTTTAAAAALASSTTAAAPLRIAVVGDLHFGRNWPAARAVVPPDEGVGFLDDVAPTLQAATLTLGNLETALADTGTSYKCSPPAKRSGSCFSFRAPTAMARRIGEAGIDVVSLANNHAADFGFAGLRTTMDSLRTGGVESVGIGSRTATFVVQGMRVAFASFSVGELDLGMADVGSMQSQIARLDAAHDVVVVMFHGGAEGAGRTRVPRAVERYLDEYRGDVWAFAHAAVDAGADVVVGSGPHVLRGVETYRGRLIAYSLGNFSSWHTFPTRGIFAQSGILSVDLAPNGVALAAQFTSTTMEKTGRPVLDAEGGGLALVRRLSHADFGDAFFDESGLWRRGRPPARAQPQQVTSGSSSTTLTSTVTVAAAGMAAPARRADAAANPGGDGRTCTLAAETPLFRGGRFVSAAAGTALTLRQRGARFTEVDSPDGRARIANALLARCRG